MLTEKGYGSAGSSLRYRRIQKYSSAGLPDRVFERGEGHFSIRVCCCQQRRSTIILYAIQAALEVYCHQDGKTEKLQSI